MTEQSALSPLMTSWPTLSTPQKRKWIALSRNYVAMHPAEKELLHSRMTSWIKLSPEQRMSARLNFAEATQLSASEKNAKWQAYQSLTPEERSKLAAAATKSTGAANAVKQPLRTKLALVPALRTDTGLAPHIAVPSHKVDHNTLLPQPAIPRSVSAANATALPSNSVIPASTSAGNAAPATTDAAPPASPAAQITAPVAPVTRTIQTHDPAAAAAASGE